jgi:hypothetical protein
MSLPAPVTWGEPMPRTPTTRRRRLLARVAVATLTGLLVVSGIACSGDHDDGDETGTDPTAADTTTPPTTSPVTPEEEAKAVYLEFVDVVNRLLTTDPNPDDPDLHRLAVDPVLSTIRDGTLTQHAENQLWQLGDRTSHAVGPAERTSEGMTLRDCLVENDLLVDQDDGRVVHTTPLTTRELEVKLVETPSGWAVASIETTRKLDGEVSCDA